MLSNATDLLLCHCVCAAAGMHEEADKDYTRAIEIDDSNPKAYLSRAFLREELGRHTDALADYLRVVKLQSQHEIALRKVLSLSPNPCDNAYHAGWLHKRGHMNTQYQRRYNTAAAQQAYAPPHPPTSPPSTTLHTLTHDPPLLSVSLTGTSSSTAQW